MPVIAALLCALMLCACRTHPTDALPTEPPIQVMVLGVYHFANPGRDVVNMEIDDVLAEGRQAELHELSQRLAAFAPTAIAVESRRSRDDCLDPRFLEFTPQRLREDRNETVQIGHRLAHDLGLQRVYAIDEQEGELPFFPFERVQAFAAENGHADELQAMIARVQTAAAELSAEQATAPIYEQLARHNDPADILAGHEELYYSLLKFSKRSDHAGAALNYGWYARNAVIFSNLTEIARPGDRVLLVYGAGHAYWLRHFAEHTPGFELVDPLSFLLGEKGR